jgi:four helix bundle protein
VEYRGRGMEKTRDLKVRTRDFALNVIRLAERVPKGVASDVIVRQLIRSATSVGANYRAACRARSRAEFEAKMQIAMEEADECTYWLELLMALEFVVDHVAISVRGEASDLTAILVAGLKTSRSKS